MTEKHPSSPLTAQQATERFTGHGAEWKPANLSATEAQLATQWVEQKIDRRSMLTNKDRVEDVRDAPLLRH